MIKEIIRHWYYLPDTEYWVHIRDIKVPNGYKKSRIGHDKWMHKLTYFRRTGNYESPILIDKDFNLIDGYSSLKLAYVNDLGKVPVYFVER